MKKFNQILSLTLSSALMLTSAPWPAAAVSPVAEMPAFAQALAPAESLGYVASSYSPSGDVSRPRLIVIADLHAHVEVQHHIVDMLDGLVSKLTTGPEAQKQVQIFVEGGWQPHLEHPLASVQSPKLRSIMSEYFLQKAEIPATQAFSERHPTATNFTLTGVENKDEYEANRARFLESYPVRKRLLEAIARHEGSLKDLSSSVEARSYQKLQDMRQAYQSGSLSGDRYARALVHQASRFNIENRYVEILQQPNAASNPQFDLALSEVSRMVSAKLAESRPLSAFFRGDEKTVRANIATVDAYLDLLKRTLGNQLTPEEVPYAFARIPQMAQVAKILLANESLDIDITNALQQSLAFYPFAFMRNDSLVGNSLAALQKGAPTDTGILVVGGFHSEAISQYLQSHQIPYILINPIVSRDLSTVEQLNYVERMAGEHVTSDEVRSDFTHPFGQAIVTRAATSVTPISDIAPEASPAAGIAPQIEAVKESIDETGKPTGKPGTAPYGSAGNPFWAKYAAAVTLGVIVNRAAGLSVVEGAPETAESRVRTDAIKALVQSYGAKAPIEGKMLPELQASYEFNGSTYKASGPLATLFAPAVGVMRTIPDAKRITPKKLYVQGVSKDVYAKFAIASGNVQSVDEVDHTPFITVGIGQDETVTFFNMDRLNDLKRAGQAIDDLIKGNGGTIDTKALVAQLSILHEFEHVFGGDTFVDEAAVQGNGIIGLMQLVANAAAAKGFEHAVTVGTVANTIPSTLVKKTLKAISTEIPGNNGSESIVERMAALSSNNTLQLSTVRNVVRDMLHLDFYRNAAQKQVKEEEQSLLQTLAAADPKGDPAQMKAAVDAAMQGVSPLVMAAFPQNKTLREKAKNIYQGLMASARNA